MTPKRIQNLIARLVVAGLSLLLVACPPVNPTTKTVPVTPMCTLQAVIYESNPKVDSVLETERTDPTVDHGFVAFHSMNKPVGNPAVGFTTDVYGINEAWLRNTAAVQVFRAQATPARRRGASSGFDGSAWSVETQDDTGTWSLPFAGGSINHGETDDPATGGPGVAQLMPVGSANPEMFACAGDRTEDHQETTTSLFELMAPNASKQVPGSQTFIQDVLNGDDHFVPNAPGPGLHGPANPPSPRVSGPGDPIRNGSVQCAMLQTGDDVTTRELHMLAVQNGTLYHSVASNFGPATSGTFFTGCAPLLKIERIVRDVAKY